MVNKRMLAVAAVLVLAVPALGAASTIVAGPVTEQLVEGHTVFTVIQVANTTSTVSANFAAAVAVLVREQVNSNGGVRFPGVLWFNDQYLVNPNSPGDSAHSYRYPCGGAVMAVNQGDPDPRMLLVDVNGNYPLNNTAGQTTQGSPDYDAITGVGYGNNRSVVGVDTTNQQVYTDTGRSGLTSGIDYKESYTITDPNDHTWQIDKYQGYTRDTIGSSVQQGQTIYSYPVWVVNIMGGRAFIPDDGVQSCQPYADEILNMVYSNPSYTGPKVYPEDTTRQEFCAGGPLNDKGQTGGADVSPLDMPARDQPCKGYAQPAGNSPSGAGVPGDNTSGGYCYDGNVHVAGTDCNNTALYPVRLYNALLYFKFQDLHPSGVITHNASNADTNGCQAGTEWACPNGDDNAEGNSHPFNPYGNSATTPDTGPNTGQPCPPGGFGDNPVNHGGSDGTNLCNHNHAVALIDLYFDAAGRPMPPLQPRSGLAKADTQGSDAPFAGAGSAST